ncbi:hypothetical protein ACFE04_010509 [Oxalis oulophora]
MADSFWRYNDGRQPPPPPQSMPPVNVMGKRPRTEYDPHSVHGLPNYQPHDDTDSINASYDRYLRNAQIPSFGGPQPPRPINGGMPGRPMDDPHMAGILGMDPGMSVKERPLGFGGSRPEISLPPDASNTLFVEGLSSNCSRRESDIFRPFVGYKEVRLVSKESRHSGGDPLILCFVDFVSPAHAATAMDALQVFPSSLSISSYLDSSQIRTTYFVVIITHLPLNHERHPCPWKSKAFIFPTPLISAPDSIPPLNSAGIIKTIRCQFGGFLYPRNLNTFQAAPKSVLTLESNLACDPVVSRYAEFTCSNISTGL